MGSLTTEPFLIILSPGSYHSYRRDPVTDIRRLLAAEGLNADIRKTSSLSEVTAIAEKATGSYRLIVAGGGDGTIGAVAAGLTGSRCILGILPFGSGNDIAKGLRIPNNIHGAMRLLQNGIPRCMDVGLYRTGDRLHGSPETNQNPRLRSNGLYINSLGMGFDGKVSNTASTTLLFRGRMKYMYGVLRSLFTYRAFEMTVELDDEVISDRLLMVTVANGRFEGGGIPIAPQADVFDGKLDVVMIRDTGIFARVPLLLRVLMRGAVEEPRVMLRKSRTIRIQSSHSRFAHADGELIGSALTHITVSVKPRALHIITGLSGT